MISARRPLASNATSCAGTQEMSLLEKLPVGIAIVDANGGLLYVNQQTAKIFASSKEAMTGCCVDSLLPNGSQQRHVADRASYTRDPREMTMGAGRELFARRGDGSEFPVEVALRPIVFQGEPATLATIADVTERRDSALAFRQLFESASSGLVLVDRKSAIARTNKRLNQMFGYEPDELIGQPIEMLLPHRSRERHPPLREAFAASPAPRMMGNGRDLTGRRKDGVEIPIEIGLSAFDTASGRMTCATVVDITLRKRSELKLREANAQLEEFAYVAAHDLRSPLRGIANLIDFVVEDFGDQAPANAIRNLQRMRERVGAAERLIDDLLTYARASRRTTKFETIELAVIIDEILASHPLPAGLRFEQDLASTAFEGARTPLATVIRNLISNAIKHHDREELRIQVRSRDEGEYVVIDVVDDGPGIPEAAQERIFRLFQTLSKSEKKGTGLGLAVAQRLVGGHGGRIDIVSSDGQRGCVFRVWWPRITRSDLDE